MITESAGKWPPSARSLTELLEFASNVIWAMKFIMANASYQISQNLLIVGVEGLRMENASNAPSSGTSIPKTFVSPSMIIVEYGTKMETA